MNKNSQTLIPSFFNDTLHKQFNAYKTNNYALTICGNDKVLILLPIIKLHDKWTV